MLFPKLKRWALQEGWKLGKSKVYGEYNGYLFTAFDGSGFKCFSTFLPFLTDDQRESLIADLNQNKKALGISEYQLENGLLNAIFKETLRSMKLEQMQQYLDHLTAFLQSKRVDGAGHCSICNEPGNHETYFFQDVFAAVCTTCFEQSCAETELAAREYAQMDRNYVPGFLGALLGGLLAAIPWIVLSYMGWMAAILGFVIGKASLKGYLLFKGRPGKATRWIILGVTAFSVVFAEVTAVIVSMIFADIPVTFHTASYVLSIPEVTSELWLNIFIGWGMAFLGMFSLFSEIKNDVENMVPKLEKA